MFILLLFISLSTQSGNFWIHSRKPLLNMKLKFRFINLYCTTNWNMT